ncbi:hypothetical protein B0H10DRAFT_2190322 [Mycena sp. CBHHK59/15]|nr:hypothetical protein B0H10DRAFT_2190322 [Mycena sp. CBHHK59/15]
MAPRRKQENTDQGEVPACPTAEPEVQPAPDGPESPVANVPADDGADVFGDGLNNPGRVGPQPHGNVHFEDDSDGEHFPSPPPSASPTPSGNHSPLPMPSRRCTRGSPRAGLHASPSRAPPARPAGGRSGSTKDVWTFFEVKGANTRECLFCKQHHVAGPHVKSTTFVMKTSSGVLRKHLYEHHLEAWVEGCDMLKYRIKAKEAQPYVDEYCAHKRGKTGTVPNPEPDKNQQEFSQEAFVDALVEFISLNVVKNAQLRAIFLMLRAELKDSDIPHRTKIRKWIMDIWDEHLNTLQREMAHRYLPKHYPKPVCTATPAASAATEGLKISHPLVCLRTLIMLAVLFGKAEKPCTQRDSKKVMEEELLMQALAEKEEDNIPFDGAIEIDPDDKYLFRL